MSHQIILVNKATNQINCQVPESKTRLSNSQRSVLPGQRQPLQLLRTDDSLMKYRKNNSPHPAQKRLKNKKFKQHHLNCKFVFMFNMNHTFWEFIFFNREKDFVNYQLCGYYSFIFLSCWRLLIYCVVLKVYSINLNLQMSHNNKHAELRELHVFSSITANPVFS